jgi:hypothetical protein
MRKRPLGLFAAVLVVSALTISLFTPLTVPVSGVDRVRPSAPPALAPNGTGGPSENSRDPGPTASAFRVSLHYSVDAGGNNNTVRVANVTDMEYPRVAVDRYAPGAYNGTVYVVGTVLAGNGSCYDLVTARSRNGSANFTPPTVAAACLPTPFLDVAVANDTVFVAAPGPVILSSSDAGGTWTLMATLSTSTSPTSLAVDPQTAGLYVAWSSSAMDAAGSLFVASSFGGGRVWSAPVSVLNASDQGMAPQIAVDGSSVVVGYISGGPVDHSVMAAVSEDGGRTWGVHQNLTGPSPCARFAAPSAAVSPEAVFAISWYLDPSYSGSDCWGIWGNDTRTYVSTLAHGATTFSAGRVVGGPPGWPTNSFGNAIAFDSHERMYVTWHSIAPNWSSAQVYVANSTALGPNFAEANFTTRVQMGGGNSTAQENLASGYNDTVYLAWVAFDPSGDPHGPLAGVFIRTITGEANASVAFNGPGSPPTTTVSLQDAATGTAYPLGTWTGSALTRTGLPASTYQVIVHVAGDVSVAGIMPVATWSRTDVSLTISMTSPLTGLASAVPSTTDVGLAVDFGCTASGGTPPLSFTWSFGDGTGAVGATTSHAYVTPGARTAVCNVTDNAGGTANAGVSVQVRSLPTVFVLVSRAIAAPGTPLNFSALSAGGVGPWTYAWRFGDGTVGSGIAVAHAYRTPGTFNVSLIVTDSVGGRATGSLFVTIVDLTVFASSSATSILAGANVTFSAAALGGAGGPYTYTWSFGDGQTANGWSVSHAYAQPGVFTPRATVMDAAGATNTTVLGDIVVSTLTVPPGPAASALYWILGGIAVAAAAVAVALYLLRRRRGTNRVRGRSSDSPRPPGP